MANPDEARKAFEERREALRHVEAKGQVEKENLRDLTLEQIENKLLALQQSVPDYPTKRVLEPAISPNLESAKKERANAEAAQQTASGESEAARESLDAARSVRDGLSAKHQEVSVRLEMFAKELSCACGNLERGRKDVPDDELEAKLREASRAVSSEAAGVRTAEISLKAKNPERVKALAETAKGSLQTTQNRWNVAQTELTEVQTRLKIHGEEGLHEKLHVVQTRFERFTIFSSPRLCRGC